SISWNLFASIRRTESVEGMGDAGCHEIDRPAANRCLLSVNQMAMSDADCGPSGRIGMVGETETAPLADARVGTPAPSTPRPRSDALMKARLEPVSLVRFMWPLNAQQPHCTEGRARGQPGKHKNRTYFLDGPPVHGPSAPIEHHVYAAVKTATSAKAA